MKDVNLNTTIDTQNTILCLSILRIIPNCNDWNAKIRTPPSKFSQHKRTLNPWSDWLPQYPQSNLTDRLNSILNPIWLTDLILTSSLNTTIISRYEKHPKPTTITTARTTTANTTIISQLYHDHNYCYPPIPITISSQLSDITLI